MKLGADVLREYLPTEDEVKSIKRNPIYLVLDEILDTFNIGSLFRLADACACEKIYLTGKMETPPSIKIHKSAVGTERWVPWEHRDDSVKLVTELKNNGVYIATIEQSPRSIKVSQFSPTLPVALVVGHETKGVREEILKLSDSIVELPMLGINKSFNVWGSASVVAFRVIELLEKAKHQTQNY